MNIKKGDSVKIMTGKDSGKTGKVMKVDSKNLTVLIEGLNMFKKHVRPKKQGEKGQTVSLPRPLTISKIMLICPNCKKAVRVGYRFEKEGAVKTRYCRKCQGVI